MDSKEFENFALSGYRLLIKGRVQGVGFRPFVLLLARSLSLPGGIRNCAEGVEIKIVAQDKQFNRFLSRLQSELPSKAQIVHLHIHRISELQNGDFPDPFQILRTEGGSQKEISIPPDQAMCSECLKEFWDPQDRRYLYPFTSCTQCGPRFSILKDTPFDRSNTSLVDFPLCNECQKEYESPQDRRFHAQGICCAQCGPHYEFVEEYGQHKQGDLSSILWKIKKALLQGQILALKGIGGYQLLVDARNSSAVERLRLKKHRPHKPFAMMLASLGEVEKISSLSDVERNLLNSSEAPVVLVKKNKNYLNIDSNQEALPCDLVAPGSAYWGVILPYSGIHHLITQNFPGPLIFTSANFSEDPLLFEDEEETFRKLFDMADMILTHNLRILRPLDDSIMKVVCGESTVLRLGRGLVPIKFSALRDSDGESTMGRKEFSDNSSWIGHGASAKSSVAILKDSEVIVGPYLGDIKNIHSAQIYEKCVQDLSRMLNINNLSSQNLTEENSMPHHQAHMYSVIGEHRIKPPFTALVWDGLGLGDHGELWGCEGFCDSGDGVRRFITMRSFFLLGGDLAAREPRRVGLALLWEIWKDQLWTPSPADPLLQWAQKFLSENFSPEELKIFWHLLTKGAQQKQSFLRISSMGRLFDGVASLLGMCQKMTYEAQAALLLEDIANGSDSSGLESYSTELKFNSQLNLNIFDFQKLIMEIIHDLIRGQSKGTIAKKFHLTLDQWILDAALLGDCPQVILTGGCFQNQVLLENAIKNLRRSGFVPYWNKLVPANDGGISFGIVARKFAK